MSERLAPRLRAALTKHSEKLRFLIVGGWNTLFSYGAVWLLDTLLRDRLHYTVILTLAWIVGVTQNLFTFKLLVFRTKGNWIKEYLRSYLVYGAGFFINLAVVTVILQFWNVRLFVAQLPAILIVTVVSYVGHKYFTYKTPGPDAAAEG